MRAAVLHRPAPLEEGPVTLVDRPEPSPGPGQIVMEVAACGVCRSNLHMVEGDWVGHGVPSFTPIVPGHEVVGRVVEIGDGVDWLRPGDRVGVQPLWSSCGHCAYCLSGREQLCRSKEITGESVDGGYAERMLAVAAHVHPVPEALDDAEAAPLFCPGITAYNAVSKLALHPGQSMAVFGVGGVGHMAIQLARLAGAEVFGIARTRQHLELAESLGATAVDDSNGRALATLQAVGGVDAAVVFAPSDKAVADAVAAVRPGGAVVLGVHADVGAVPFYDEKRVLGSVIGSRQQMRDVLALAAAGKLRAEVEAFPLDAAADVLGRLKRGEVRARAVLVPALG
jgi:propanol-preferring alcohol dehydrogenase